MAVSPICLVKDGLGPYVLTPNGVDVTPGNTVSVKLDVPLGVVDWYFQVVGTDEMSTAPALSGVNPITNKVSAPTTVVTFTAPSALGRAFVFKSTVTGVGGPLATTFGIYLLTGNSRRVGAVGETRESSTAFGWATIINPLIRSGAPVILYDDTLLPPSLGANTLQAAIDTLKAMSFPPTGFAGGDLSGTYPNPTVAQVNGTTVPTTGVGDVGKVLTVTGTGTAIWDTSTPAGSASGDLSGTYPGPSVAKVNGTTVPVTVTGDVSKVLTVTAAGASTWQSLPAPTPAFSAGGDLSGSNTSQTVEKVKGTTVTTAGGALTTGAVLTVTGSSSADWQVPATPFTAGGDLSGTATNQTVEKVHGTAVPVTLIADVGKVLTVTGAGAATWSTASPAGSAGGDLGGSYPNPDVFRLHGTTVPVTLIADVGKVLTVTGAGTSTWQVIPTPTPTPFTSRLVFPGCASTQTNAGTGAGTFLGIGAIPFDPSALSTGGVRTIVFRAVLEGSTGVTAEVRLYNIDAGTVVTGTTLSATATTPTRVVSATLTVGGLGNIQTTLQTYEVQLRISAPGSPGVSDETTCKAAWLEASYA